MNSEESFREALELAGRLDRALIHYDPIQYALLMAFFELKHSAPRQYSIFVLRHIKGMAVPQICKALGVSRDVVDQNIIRARSALKEALCRYPEIQAWLRATGRIGTTAGSGGADQGIDRD